MENKVVNLVKTGCYYIEGSKIFPFSYEHFVFISMLYACM